METQVFRTPEQVAPELGITKTELRRYCKASGIFTQLGNRKMVLHTEDIPKLVTWIRKHKAPARDWAAEATEVQEDPWAPK